MTPTDTGDVPGSPGHKHQTRRGRGVLAQAHNRTICIPRAVTDGADRAANNRRWGSPFNRSSAGQGHATNNRTNGHFGAVTSANVGYLPPAGPLRWRAPIPDSGRPARPANDMSKARADVSSTVRWRTPRHPGPAIITELPRHAAAPFSSLGTIRMDSPAPPPNPTAAKPRDGRVLSRPSSRVHEPRTLYRGGCPCDRRRA